MGVSYSAITIFACRVVASKKVFRVIRPGCQHKNAEGIKFCPMCGQPVTILSDEQINLDEIKPSGGNIYVTDGTYQEKNVGGKHFSECDSFVGCKGLEKRAYDGNTDLIMTVPSQEQIDRCKSEVAAFLGPLGLWDEKEWGIWTVLYCSY